MAPKCNANRYMNVLFILIMVGSSFSIDCPRKCHCSSKTIDCRNAGVTEIPKDIPLTVTGIYLSCNPLLHMPASYFLKFSKLETLLLRSVGQRDPIFLPNSLIHFDFSFNLITIDSLKLMLKGQLNTLKRLELEGNNLNITEIFPILPKGIETVILNGNRLVSLARNDLKCCMNLKEFRCSLCSLKYIEPNAFENLNEITIIVLSNNELVDLPERIFEGLPRLLQLEIRSNYLESFNASKVRLKKLNALELGYNRINRIDLQHSKITDIGLEHNRIKSLGAKTFGSSFLIHELSLQRNEIKEISERVFENVKFISALILHSNNIESLPDNLLNNTFVGMLFLHNNSLSNVDKFILGMKKLPALLTLFSNKKIKHLNTSIFKGIKKHSRIFISCNSLKTITISSNKRVSLHCCPSSDLIIATPFRFMEYDGYECKWKGKQQHYICRACPIGFYDGSDAINKSALDCAPCPAGSFYQDELASLRCKNCPIGQYVPPSRSPGKDASDCQTCPRGTNTSRPAGTRACSCLKGYHRRYRFGACEKCRSAGFECVRDYPQLKQGFWMTWNGTGLSNRSCKHEFQSYMLNLETFTNDYDRNTVYFKCQLPIPIKCPKPGSCHGGIESKCSSGYTGVLCGVCRKGYKSLFNRCVKCPKIYLTISKWILYIAFFIFLCFLVSDKNNNDSHRMKRMQRCVNSENRTVVEIFISSFKILIGFYQTLIGVKYAYNSINWPNNLIAVISVMEYIQFEVIRIPSLRCISPKWTIDAVGEFWLSIVVFTAFPMLCLIYYLVKSCQFYCQETYSLNIKRRRNLCGRNCVRIAALFMFIIYPLISTRIIHILPVSCDMICTAYHKGACLHHISYLRSDYSLACPTMSTHRYTLIVAYCCLIIPCGLPLLLWAALRQSLRKYGEIMPLRSKRQYVTIVEQDEMDDNSDQGDVEDNNPLHWVITDDISGETSPVFANALRFTYENYEDKFWYWEVTEMIRKLIMTAGAALFLHNTKVGLSVLIIVGILFAILHAIHKPIKDGFENFLQMLSVWIVPINLSAGAVIQANLTGTDVPDGDVSASWKVGIFLIVINSLLITLVVGRFAKLIAEKKPNRAF